MVFGPEKVELDLRFVRERVNQDDFAGSFDNGHSVRYHPSADPIWSTTSPQPTDAMQKRYNRAKKLGRRGTGVC